MKGEKVGVYKLKPLTQNQKGGLFENPQRRYTSFGLMPVLQPSMDPPVSREGQCPSISSL
jgi:hypothetical protein